MANRFQKRKDAEKHIALERIKELFHQANAVFKKHPDRANTYVTHAWRISTRSKTRLPIELKRQICRKCFYYLKPGITARIRLNKGKKTYVCMHCGSIVRIPYKGKK